MKNVKVYLLIASIAALLYGIFDIIKGIARLNNDKAGIVSLVFGVIFIVIAVRSFISYHNIKKLEDMGDDDDQNDAMD